MHSPVGIIDTDDPAFPSALRDVAVTRIFIRGALPDADRPRLAVVGTRRSSPEGERATRELVGPLARAGVVIVSGLAEGIDTVAHMTALEEGGTTVAIAGTGLDDPSLYPQSNVGLARRIAESGGAVLSEYSPGTTGRKSNFPKRNRLIAALAHVTLVVEAPERSGALITANCAKQLGRIVAAVPGSFYNPNAQGSNHLLERGAAAVTSASTLARLLGIAEKPSKSRASASAQSTRLRSPTEGHILSLLAEGPCDIDRILQKSSTSVGATIAALSLLEERGIIEDMGGKRFSIKRHL